MQKLHVDLFLVCTASLVHGTSTIFKYFLVSQIELTVLNLGEYVYGLILYKQVM